MIEVLEVEEETADLEVVEAVEAVDLTEMVHQEEDLKVAKKLWLLQIAIFPEFTY